jgi:hypothetical protein
MNPIFKKSGMTPTAAIAFRAEAQAKRAEFAAKARESLEAKGVSISKDAYKNAMTARLNATKLGEDGNPVDLKFIWNPTTKTVTRQQSAPIVAAPQMRRR